jgi:hypothetical protein
MKFTEDWGKQISFLQKTYSGLGFRGGVSIFPSKLNLNLMYGKDTSLR